MFDYFETAEFNHEMLVFGEKLLQLFEFEPAHDLFNQRIDLNRFQIHLESLPKHLVVALK